MTSKGKWFDHIIVMMFENESDTNVLLDTYMSELRRSGVYLTQSHGVCHPSQPNYIAAIGGDTLGFPHTPTGPDKKEPASGWDFAGDNVPQQVSLKNTDPLDIKSIVDLLEEGGLTWRAYMENLPGTCGRSGSKTDLGASEKNTFTNQHGNSDAQSYLSRHNPFVSFPRITRFNRLQHVVDASELAGDIATGKLANFSWYTPDMYNDGHTLPPAQDTPANQNDPTNQQRVTNIANWTSGFFSRFPIVPASSSVFPPRTLIVLTFDENGPYTEKNEIYTLLLGPDVLEGIAPEQDEISNHYNLLRTIEDNFGIGTLGRHDETATSWSFLSKDSSYSNPGK